MRSAVFSSKHLKINKHTSSVQHFCPKALYLKKKKFICVNHSIFPIMKLHFHFPDSRQTVENSHFRQHGVVCILSLFLLFIKGNNLIMEPSNLCFGKFHI